MGRDDPRSQRRIAHADILPQGRWRTKVDPGAGLRQYSGMSSERGRVGCVSPQLELASPSGRRHEYLG